MSSSNNQAQKNTNGTNYPITLSDKQYQNYSKNPECQAMEQQQIIDDATDYVKLCDQTLESRNGFIKKTYALLSLEMGLTLGLIALAMYTAMGDWYIVNYYETYAIFMNPYTGAMEGGEFIVIEYTLWFWLSWFIAFGLQIALFCFHGVARQVPRNYIFTLLYVFCFGSWLSGVCLMFAMLYGSAFIWTAWGITFALVLSLTAYAIYTKSDFTMKLGALFIFIPCFILFTLLSIFDYSYILFYLISSLIICLYGFFLIYETQKIMGKGRVKLSIDDYILGSLFLYGTIIQLFLRILEIMAVARGGKR